jgi:peptide/nickel transport system substrate-binding protein
MANLLLQRQAEPAAALLPQWLSGYAFLFNVDTNLERAKAIRAEFPATLASVAEPLRLRVDVPGELPKLLAERIAVNARQAGLTLQVVSRPPREAGAAPSSSDPAPSLHLFAWHVTSLSPKAEFSAFLNAMSLPQPGVSESTAVDSAQLYEQERRVLDQRNLLPIVALPEYAGIGSTVRNWLPAPWGEWRLADVWLDVPEPSAPAKASSDAAAASHSQFDQAGAKP